MAIQDMFKGNIAMGLAVGLVAAVLVPVALPVIVRAARPLAKAVIKSGLIVYEKGRESFAELTEVVEDMVAEAKAEVEQEHAPKMAVSGGMSPAATSPPTPEA
jgi:hypothetical protein